MRVTIDVDKCQGHNRCYALAPELFDVDDLQDRVECGMAERRDAIPQDWKALPGGFFSVGDQSELSIEDPDESAPLRFYRLRCLR